MSKKLTTYTVFYCLFSDLETPKKAEVFFTMFDVNTYIRTKLFTSKTVILNDFFLHEGVRKMNIRKGKTKYQIQVHKQEIETELKNEPETTENSE